MNTTTQATLARCRVCGVPFAPTPDDYRANAHRVCPACREDDAPGGRPDLAAASIAASGVNPEIAECAALFPAGGQEHRDEQTRHPPARNTPGEHAGRVNRVDAHGRYVMSAGVAVLAGD